MINKVIYFRLLAFMLIVTSFLPIVSQNAPVLVGSFRWLWAPLWLISLVLFNPKVFLNKTVVSFLIYGILALFVLQKTIWFNMDAWLKKELLDEFYNIIVGLSVYIHFTSTSDYKGLAILARWSLVFILITSIISIIASSINPEYARMLTSNNEDFKLSGQALFFNKIGAGKYSFDQAIVLLIPVALYYLKYNINLIYSKKIVIAYLLIILLTIMKMGFFANVLIAVGAIIVSSIGIGRVKVSITLSILAIIIISIIPLNFYADLISYIADMFDKDSLMNFKLNDLSRFIVNDDINGSGDSGTGSRASRYPMLLNAFLVNPLFGNASTLYSVDISSGYHLHWMGKLGATGLVGILIFFMPFVIFIRRSFKTYNLQYKFAVGISIASLFMLGAMKMVAGRDVWMMFFVIVPSLNYLNLYPKQWKIWKM